MRKNIFVAASVLCLSAMLCVPAAAGNGNVHKRETEKPELSSNITELQAGDFKDVYFHAIVEGDCKKVVLYNSEGRRETELLDDGEFFTSGDDIKNDNVFSGIIHNLGSNEPAELKYYAETVKGKNKTKSNTLTINICSAPTEDGLQSMEKIDNALSELQASFTPEDSIKERKAKAEALLKAMAKEGLINEDSLNYDKSSGVYSFEYSGGILGGIMLKEFNEDSNGIEADSVDSNEEENPVGAENAVKRTVRNILNGNSTEDPNKTYSVSFENENGKKAAKNNKGEEVGYQAELRIENDTEMILKWDGGQQRINSLDEDEDEELLSYVEDGGSARHIVLPDPDEEYTLSTVSGEAEEIYFSVKYDDMYLSAEATATEVEFSHDGTVEVKGSEENIDLSLADDNVPYGKYNTFIVYGEDKIGDFSISLEDEGLEIEGKDLEDVKVTASDGFKTVLYGIVKPVDEIVIHPYSYRDKNVHVIKEN